MSSRYPFASVALRGRDLLSFGILESLANAAVDRECRAFWRGRNWHVISYKVVPSAGGDDSAM